jgi:hypothetical protein
MNTPRLHFQHLRRAQGLTSQAVADAAGISLTDEYLFEIHCLTNSEVKEKIIRAFTHLTGYPYILSDFEPVEEQPTAVMNRSHGFIGGSRELH